MIAGELFNVVCLGFYLQNRDSFLASHTVRQSKQCMMKLLCDISFKNGNTSYNGKWGVKKYHAFRNFSVPIYLKLAFIWLLLLTQSLYLMDSGSSLRS